MSERMRRMLQKQIDDATKRLMELDKLPTYNPCKTGDVLVMTRRHFTGGTHQIYTYAILYVDGVLWPTGTRTKPFTSWDSFVEWCRDEVITLEIRRAGMVSNEFIVTDERDGDVPPPPEPPDMPPPWNIVVS